MTKECRNCWFYCHSNGRCYADPRSAIDDDYFLKVVMPQPCTDWKFDGLEDWEREACEPTETLMTMELEAA